MLAARPFIRFIENQELKALETRKQAAEGGFALIKARDGSTVIRVAPPVAEAIVKSCDQRIAQIMEKRKPSL